MAWSRARGNVRKCAAILGATLLAAALTPLATSAASPARAPFVARQMARPTVVAHVDATTASHRAPRTVPAAAQLKAHARPPAAQGSTKGTIKPRLVSPSIVAIPPLTVAHTTSVTSYSDVATEPPDPWVVANSSYLISSANGQVRVMNRAGSVLANIPTYALFATDVLHYESDPRILWDATHGRWIGVVVTYDTNFVDTSLTLIVSDTANPLGTWTVHRLPYGSDLPDYPGISTTSDDIVLTSNLYLPDGTYEGTGYQVVTWASVMGGTTSAGPLIACPGDECWNFRPARNSGTPTASAYIVYEDLLSGHLTFFGTVGAGVAALPGELIDLGVADGPDNLDHTPRQPGGTISDGGDSRIPDVTMNGDVLYFARTGQADHGGLGPDLVVQEYRFSISSILGGSPVGSTNEWGNIDEDYWLPGVGISRGDSHASTGYFLSYMVSSATLPPAAYAAGSLDGITYGDPVLVASSSAAYKGTRWGDYMGITPDPSGNMAVWAATEVSDSTGWWQEVVSRLILDDTPPSTAAAPSVNLIRGTQISSSRVPVRVSWAAAADAQSGVTHYLVADEVQDFTATTGLSITKSVPWWAYSNPAKPGSYANDYAVKAVNDVGISSASWSTPSLSFRPTVFQQTLSYTRYSGAWSSQSSSAFLGGSSKYSSRAGASATFKVNGQSFGWVSYKGTTRGRAKVYLDGVYKGTFSLRSSRNIPRSLSYVASFAVKGTHTIKIVVVSGRVDVDAFVVLR